MIIKPTVGRVVLYRPHSSDPIRVNGMEPLAAMVATVWSDNCVNLVVFDANGIPNSRCSVHLVQPDELKPDDHSFCHWMEYQKGQAAKVEELELKKILESK